MDDAIRLDADPALPTALRLVLLAFLILGSGLWIGGMAAVTILSIRSRTVLAPEDRTRLFAAFGRTYFAIAGVALVVAIGCGLVLLMARGWDGLATAIVVTSAVLVVALVFGVRQARAMRALRTAAAHHPDDAAAQRAVATVGRSAALLRALLGMLSVAIFVMAICTAA